MADKPDSLYEAAYSHIKEFLLHSNIHPGQKIPHLELGSKLGISLTPLREAFFRLSAEGLLSHQKHRGFFVPEIGLAEAEELYEVREVIEPYLVEKAAKRRTEHQLKTLQESLNAYKRMTPEPHSRTRLMVDKAFHMELFKLGDNRSLMQLLDRVFDQLIIRRKLEHLPPGRAFDAYQEHLEIYNAVDKKNAKAAGRLTRSHVRSAKKFVLGDLTQREKLHWSSELRSVRAPVA